MQLDRHGKKSCSKSSYYVFLTSIMELSSCLPAPEIHKIISRGRQSPRILLSEKQVLGNKCFETAANTFFPLLQTRVNLWSFCCPYNAWFLSETIWKLWTLLRSLKIKAHSEIWEVWVFYTVDWFHTIKVVPNSRSALDDSNVTV